MKDNKDTRTTKVSSVHPAADIYNVRDWSDGYFDVNAEGNVVVNTHHDGKQYQGSFSTLLKKVEQADLRWPVLVRFSDVLHDRVHQLCSAFENAMQRENYVADYTAVYPIKVNQQRRVVEEIIKAGSDTQNHRVGLEAGSKPELLGPGSIGSAECGRCYVNCDGIQRCCSCTGTK